ncbi:hypothetical protein [Flavobacterium nackdongense]|uniref:Peptidase C-terminal archaeal/bacterial domain-containing protein n=1 Tax=Flavobacterium nackdongense TaxID=2547394 RepID=A0A4P6YHT0_9FLAO|nr:hypothetical protein [Flavobacterium nackdongense]QBN20435.1 hypothetical protein E1750_17105 [Flavobacterium nackdongense]
MKKCLKRMGLFVAILALFPVATSAQIITKKVSFPTGKSSTVINGTIVGEQTIDYTVGANAGQTLKVTLKPTSKSSYFNVLPPGSEGAADFIGQNEGNTCSLNLTKSGTYKIRVYQMRSSARRGEKATYSLSISIPASSNSGDAKVSGTNYNATGDLRAANGSKPTSAKFGVIRSNGGAEVHATMPGKSKRVFVFSQGEWTCKSTNCKLSFAKISSDEWEIICNGTEKYYIPDAVIYGG